MNTINVKTADIPMVVAPELYIEQLRLEKLMRTQGQERYFNALNANIENGQGDKTTFGNALISKNIATLAEAIDGEIQAKTVVAIRKVAEWVLMAELGGKRLAMIALQSITTRIMSKTSLTTACVAIGKAVEDEIRMQAIREYDDRAYATLMKGNKYRTSQSNKRAASIRVNRDLSAHDEWPEKVRLRTGLCLFTCIQNTLPDLFEIATLISNERGGKKTNKYIMPTQATINWMRSHVALAQFLRPVYQPMVVPPVRWTNGRVVGGGYYSNYVKPLSMVKVPSRKQLHVYTQTKMPAVFDALNAAQETAWKINPKILAVITEACERGISIGSMPEIAELDVPELVGNYTEKELEEFKKLKRNNIAENIQRRCKAASFHIIVSQAKEYASYDKIYIPYQLDFRGRLYGVPMLNPQGADYTKGLLQFAEPKAIGTVEALNFLFIHVANLFGVDKVSFDKRIEWTQSNLAELVACATDPWENQKWTEADKPFQALAACHELLGYLVNGLEHKTSIAVALDGSCSGLQNLGMALDCEVTGMSVNLIPSDTPSDIYAIVAGILTERLKQVCNYDQIVSQATTLHELQLAAIQEHVTEGLPVDLILNELSKPVATLKPNMRKIRTAYLKPRIAYEWLQFGITRSICKRPVMTYPYGSKQYGFKSQIMEDTLREVYAQDTVPFTDPMPDVAGVLAEYCFEAVESTVLKAAEAMNWLQACAKTLAGEGKPIVWQTPLGFTVTQDYKMTEQDKINTKVNGTRYQLRLSRELLEPNVRKNESSISPNYVHSLDSSHLMLTVARACEEGMKDFALIHDSFGTHVGDTPRFFNVIREAFLELYTEDDVLHSLAQQFKEQAQNPDDILPPPSKGNLVKDNILDSLYAFA